MIKKSILWCMGVTVLLTVLTGLPILAGAELKVFEILAIPFLYIGSMVGWMIKGDNFKSSEEFFRFGFIASIPVNAIIGVTGGLVVGLIRSKNHEQKK